MSYLNPQAIVSTEWLSRNINDPNLVVLDGTYHLPTANRNASEEFPLKHIEGAIFFDIDDIADADNVLPHMLPSDKVFSEKVGALGINNEKRVVVYDVYGMQSAARTWWMFRFFGHDNVAVLDGGLPKWIKEGNQISSSPVTPSPTTFVCNRQPRLVKNLNEIKEIVEDGKGADYRRTLTRPFQWHRARAKSGHAFWAYARRYKSSFHGIFGP